MGQVRKPKQSSQTIANTAGRLVKTSVGTDKCNAVLHQFADRRAGIDLPQSVKNQRVMGQEQLCPHTHGKVYHRQGCVQGQHATAHRRLHIPHQEAGIVPLLHGVIRRNGIDPVVNICNSRHNFSSMARITSAVSTPPFWRLRR